MGTHGALGETVEAFGVELLYVALAVHGHAAHAGRNQGLRAKEGVHCHTSRLLQEGTMQSLQGTRVVSGGQTEDPTLPAHTESLEEPSRPAEDSKSHVQMKSK